ncbi:MAG: hypothetical protein H6591_07375 [Flavobacteriales bacterium]|nr:hypothetical protein [Flavobacteriales bacterium]
MRPSRTMKALSWLPVLLLAAGLPAMAQRANHAGHGHEDVSALLNHHDQEIHFVENKGQFGEAVLYRADFPLGQAVATREGMLISAFDPRAIEARQREGMAIEEEIQRGLPHRPLRWQQRGHGWLMRFRDASPDMRIASKDAHADLSNYFLGGKEHHAIGVQAFQEVWYTDVYKATDVRYYPSADGSLEYDIICKPGSDPAEIALELKGIEKAWVNEQGELVLRTTLGDMGYPAPVVYQRANGRDKVVKASYRVEHDNVVRFDLDAYDRTATLVIDPIAMRWATWVNTNSSGDNHGHCIWVDPSDGAVYVVARVVGTTDQITVGAFDETANGNLEMIVGKYLEPASIGASGTRVWQTYIGGNNDDNPYAMEQGPDGNLYITGYTGSTNFPLLGGPVFTGTSIDQQAQSGDDVFVLKINTAGTSIKAAVLGGNGTDDSYDIRTAANGDVFICGSTTSTNLLTLNSGSGASNTNNGSSDVLLFRLNQDLSTLLWMRNYGGSSADQASIMLHNPSTGDLFVGGNTSSTNFPTVSPRQSTRGGSSAGFLQRLNGTTAATTWSSYFSSGSGDDANLLCMAFNEGRTELYFGGVTEGLASANITAGAYDTGHNGSNDFYVARMDLDQNLLAGTYVGGTSNEVNMMGLNVDQNNDVYVFGYTNSTNFPTSAAPNVPLQASNQGSNDKVFFKLTDDLSALEFSTYYGGTADDYDPVGERGIKFSNCRIYTIVTARSNNIPLTQGALNTTKNSSTSRYEPGLVVWANPPDLLGNSITYTGTAICAGSTPGDITGSEPSYSLPTIVRNNVASAYPSFGSAATYQWQISSDSLTWTDIAGQTGQNLMGSAIGPINETRYIRRIIGGDACILAGAADQVVTVRLMSVTGTVTHVSCNGASNGSVTAQADGLPPFNYAWSNGQTTQTATGLAPGSYSVTVTDANGCSAQNSFQVNEPLLLTAQPASTPATCSQANGTASVAAGGGTSPYTYLWSNGGTGAMISGVQGGLYSVTITDNNGCQLTVDVNVGSSGLPAVNAGSDAVITCATGAQIQLSGTADGGLDYAWAASNGGNIVSGANTLTPTVNAAGTYTLTVTNPQTNCSASDAAMVMVNTTAPDATVTGGGTVTCLITSIALDGASTTTGATFAWSGPGGFGSTDADISVSAEGTYVLTVTDPTNGCTNTAEAQVQVDTDLPGAQAAGGTITCTNACVTLQGTGNGTFSWTGPDNFTSTEQNPTVCAAGDYILTVTGSNGCMSMATANVDVDDELPGAQAAGGTITCSNACVTLQGTGNGTFSWTGPDNFTSTEQNPTVCAAGDYILTVTGSNGCTSMATANVDLDDELPGAQAAGGTITCSNACVTLQGTGNGTFSWTGPDNFTSTEQNPTVCAAGDYILTVTGSNGCTSMATANVDLDDELPGAQAAGGTITCTNACVTLQGTGNGTFSWTGPDNFTSTEQNPTVCAAGDYILTVTGSNGCTSMATANVDLDDELPGAQAAGGTITCTNACVTLQGTGNGTFSWTGPDNFTSTEQNPTVCAAGDYILTVTGSNGCMSMATANVDVDDELPGAQAAGGTITCSNACVTLQGTGNGTFSWTGPDNFTSTEQNPTVCAAGDYILTVTGSNGCTSMATANVDLDDELPGAQAAGGTITCTNACVTLQGTGNGTFSWTGPDNFTSTEQNPTVCAAGEYILTVTGSNGCTSMATANVDVDDELPGAQAAGGTITCSNACVTLQGTGNGSFSWTGPDNFTSTEQNPTVCAAGDYILTVTGSNGCTSMATANVDVDDELPGAQATGGTITCTNACVTLQGTGNGTFSWTGPDNFTSTEQNPTVCAAGDYILTVTGANGCTSMATANVDVDDELPGAQAAGGTITCSNACVTLQGTGNGSFSWTGPDNFTSTEQNPTVCAAGEYILTVTGSNGCTSIATANVDVDDELPGAQATGGTITCTNACVTLQGTGNGSFSWTGPDNFTSTEQNPTVCAAGDYILTVTGSNGCTSTATATVDVDDELPGAQAAGGTITCTNACVTLQGTGNGTFSWTGPDNFTSTEQNPTVCAAGDYILTVTGSNGCTSMATANVDVDDELPGAQAAGGTITCTNACVILQGTGNGSFSWTGPDNFTSTEQNPTVCAAGDYILTVTGSNGCTSMATANVDVDDELPGAQAAGGTITCTNACVTLQGTGNGTFSWTGPDNFTSTEQNPTVCAAGDYILTVTGSNGCTSTATATVDVDDELPGAQAAGGTITCTNACVTLQGTGNGTFSWTGPDNFTSTEQNPTVCAAGDYILTVTGSNGCTSMATANVDVDDELPGAQAAGGTITCTNACVTLQGTGNGTFSWTGPDNFTSDLQNPTVCAAGEYILTVTGSNGCTSMAIANVDIEIAVPMIYAEGGSLDCTSGEAQLSAGANVSATFSWSGPNGYSSTQQNPVVTMTGLYTVTVTAENGCSATGTAMVTQDCGECGPIIEWCPPDITVQCHEDISPFGVVGEPVIRKDKDCPEVTSVGWSDDILSNCPYVILRTYWAQDETGAYETCTQYITLIDEVAPVFVEVPQDITIACDGDIDGVSVPEVEAYDECTKMFVPVTHNMGIVQGDCAGSYTIMHTWSATDQCGNTSVASWSIHVMDNVAPTLVCDVTDIVVECDDLPAPKTCQASDNCDANVEVTVEDIQGEPDAECKYQVTRTYTATDDCGNSTSIVQHIIVWCPGESCGGVEPKLLVTATPNPFRDMCRINFTPHQSGQAHVLVTDLMGRKVADLYNGEVAKGVPVSLEFRPLERNGGTYIYRIRINGEETIGRLIAQP